LGTSQKRNYEELIVQQMKESLGRICKDGVWDQSRNILMCGFPPGASTPPWLSGVYGSRFFNKPIFSSLKDQKSEEELIEWAAFGPVFDAISDFSSQLQKTLGKADEQTTKLLTSIVSNTNFLKKQWELNKSPAPKAYFFSLVSDMNLLESITKVKKVTGRLDNKRTMYGKSSSTFAISPINKFTSVNIVYVTYTRLATISQRRIGKAKSKNSRIVTPKQPPKNSFPIDTPSGHKPSQAEYVPILKDVADDLQIKVDQAKSSSQHWASLINVEVYTIRKDQVVNGEEVYYVPKAWANVPQRHVRFRQLSSPTNEHLPPARYEMRTNGAVPKTFTIGGDGRDRQRVDLVVP
jgi:hypothetical protein